MSIMEPIPESNIAQAPSTPMNLPEELPASAPESSPNKAITQIASDIQNTSLADHEADVEAETTVVVPQIKLCSICNSNEAKYKCVRCYLPYCSLACSNVHKATHTNDEPLPAPIIPEPTIPKDVALRAGTVGFRSPFAVLDGSKELQELFLQFPDLREHLNSVHEATLRPVDDYGQQRQGKKQPWNQDQGMMKGVEALHRAKGKYGRDGEGVREYGRLVLQLLERESNIGAQEIIQKEIEDESARIIRQLIEMER